MQTIQLAITDSGYAAVLREALVRSGPWLVESVVRPNPDDRSVLVIDEACLARLSLPLPYPERVVLLTRKDPANLSHAWEAGIVSLVSPDDPPTTILLAIMAAALRVPKLQPVGASGDITPSRPVSAAPISPDLPLLGAKRFKTQ